MRFMMLLKGDQDTEAGTPPTEEGLAAMAKYNEELVKAGALLDGAGLKPTSTGALVRFEGGRVTVTDGPFAESKEVIAGYWMIQVDSLEEAVEWARRCPAEYIPHRDGVAEIELRPLYELEDFAPGEAIKHHRRIQAEIEGR